MHQHHMEKLDATGKDAMFGEDDINFDLQLEKFGIDTSILKEPAVQRIFCAWVEDWEEEARKKMTVCWRCSCFLSFKYKGLVFCDPDSDNDLFVFGNKTWSSVVGEEMDGSCLEYVPLTE